jgi:drug/metabolite transporter (DMT)-like permease
VLLAVIAGRFGHWSALFGSWAVYAGVVVGVLGLLLAQIAFQTGDIGAPLAALTITEPLVAVVLAVTVLHDDLPSSGGALAAAIAGAVLSVSGVLVLCRKASAERLPVGVHV